MSPSSAFRSREDDSLPFGTHLAPDSLILFSLYPPKKRICVICVSLSIESLLSL
jgi:hypothetical protein